MSGLSEVYVVKDEAPAKVALTSLLARAGIPSRTFDSGSAFLAICGDLPRGCVITNFRTQGMDALEFLRRLGAEPVSFPAIIIAGGPNVLQAVEAMKAGAVTVLERPYDDEVLLGAIHAAMELPSPQECGPLNQAALATLTRREQQVLGGVLEGKTNKTIARHLGISPRTVEVYRASVMEKTGVSSIAQLVRLAVGAKRVRLDACTDREHSIG